MAESVCFRTRARTIDHLGREQIADCPTAVSELWKNAYDAYARSVSLDVYDGEIPIATVADDGHGMSRNDFVDKWLVVGTESKATAEGVHVDDRNGLSERPRQGQKGIGRLSAAALGRLMLIVSKHRNNKFTAALIDWRLFENPFLILQDIEIPVVEFDLKEELFSELPDMFDSLMSNIWGDKADAKKKKKDVSERTRRIVAAWSAYDELEKEQQHDPDLKEEEQSYNLTREAIESVIIDAAFDERHFSNWPVWQSKSETGTILAIGDLAFDLEALLPEQLTDVDADLAKHSRDTLRQTLSSFIDPFSDGEEGQQGRSSQVADEFTFAVSTWEGGLRRTFLSPDKEFGRKELEELEHVVSGIVDEHGVFHGRIKTFGVWQKGKITIKPQSDVPERSNTRVGPFHIRLGTIEQLASSSSHAPDVHEAHMYRADRHAGIMVHRDGLRVMPYGREDNDFFEIEKRRSMHAGRAFWANRRTFGRIAITRDSNPNLRDKAGREGIIENKAAKAFRNIVENILVSTAKTYFGTKSEPREKLLPEIQARRTEERVVAERNKQRVRQKKQFSERLKRFTPELAALYEAVENLADRLRREQPKQETQLFEFREMIGGFGIRMRELMPGEPPHEMGASLEALYAQYRHTMRETVALLSDLNESVNRSLNEVASASLSKLVNKEVVAAKGFLRQRLDHWLSEAKALLDSERERLSGLTAQSESNFLEHVQPILDDVQNDRVELVNALARLSEERDRTDSANALIFEPYISALSSLRDNIDLELLAVHGLDQTDDLRAQAERLHGLAQLGITVEIIGHEIEGLEQTITEGLQDFPKQVQASEAYSAVVSSHEALVERLRFLSPLKLSGPRNRAKISGEKILQYVRRFFGDELKERAISLDGSEAFKGFTLYEMESRIYPVFINLVNNAAYWVSQSKRSGREILLDVCENKVVIADDGPGVEPDDVPNLFSLFFTRKLRGGRGVGLYLCRANLAAGGHTIEYIADGPCRRLPGANFLIDFKGAEYV